MPGARLRQELAAQTRRALVYPVFFGSAVTGAGVPELMAGLAGAAAGRDGRRRRAGLRPRLQDRARPGGEKLAYVRMFSGTIRTRDRLRFSASPEGAAQGKVTAIGVFERGTGAYPGVRPRLARSPGCAAWTRSRSATRSANRRPGVIQPQFAPPTLESVIAARRPADRAALHVALGQLAEQDPLINVRQSPGELAVSLYGEVQKEVIQATLADDFGIEVTFRETTTICIERPVGSGQAAELLGAPGNPFPPRSGCGWTRRRPAPASRSGSTWTSARCRCTSTKTVGNFAAMMTQYVTQALREGPHGWRVTDCTVTMIECGYISPSTTAAHFRKLTPLVLMAALDQAGTVVCEPMIRVSLEIPAETSVPCWPRWPGSAGRRERRPCKQTRACWRRCCPPPGRRICSGSCPA